MSEPPHFRVQLVSILEMLAKAAVVEICELVDNGYATLHLEISRSNSENDALRRKLQIMEQKLSHKGDERSSARDREFKPDPGVVCDYLGGSENRLPQNSEQMFDQCFSQWRGSPLDVEPKPALFTTGYGMQKVMQGLTIVKDELLEESTSRTEVENRQDGTADSGAAVADIDCGVNTQLTTQREPELLCPDLKTEPDNNGADPRLQKTGTDHRGHSSINYENDLEQLTWSRMCLTEMQHTQYREREREEEQHIHLSHAAWPLRQSQPPHSTQSKPQSQSRCSAHFVISDKDVTVPAAASTFQTSIRKQKKKKFTCSLCGKSLSSQGCLKNHMRLHTGVRPFTCTQCGKSFSKSDHLKSHHITHTRARPYACKLCPKTFGLPCNLKRHQLMHTREKHFRCSECGKTFPKAAGLKIHQITHTGDRPYACEFCPKTYTDRSNLNRHLQTHKGRAAATTAAPVW